jgi:4-hydroxybenzoate polyprenyltransferase
MFGAAFRIVTDVVVYRVRRLEMANLVATLALMVTLRTGVADFAARAGFAVLLNVFAYLNNDYQDVTRDLAERRELEKTRFLAEHRGTALVVQVALVAVLCASAALYDPGLLLAVVLGAGLCVLYSGFLKGVPILDIVAMAAWGVGMTEVAFPMGSALGWKLALQLGLFSAIFETIQVVRDHDADVKNGVRTTAVLLGPKRTLAIARGLIVVSSAYGVAVLHRYLPLVQLAALAVPASPEHVERYWTSVRLVLGVSLLAVFGWVLVTGTTNAALFLR